MNQLSTTQVFDVVIVGASLAGCTAARLFALEGLSVALVERSAARDAYKRHCSHYIQASARPVLRRLGLDKLLDDVGAIRNGMIIWTKHGWVEDVPLLDDAGEITYGYNVQRKTLDPLLRELAVATPGVIPFFGVSASKLVNDEGRIGGVWLADGRKLSGTLIVAADGRDSMLAKLAGLVPKLKANSRFDMNIVFGGIPSKGRVSSKMWFHGGAVTLAMPNDQDTFVVAHMDVQEKYADFRADPVKLLVRTLANLPNGPDLSSAPVLRKPQITKRYDTLFRRPFISDMALVGDALMTLDPLFGLGCGFAFQQAAWLVDSTVDALRRKMPITHSLRRYAGTLGRNMRGHVFLNNDFSRRRNLNAIEHLMFAAAAKDRIMAQHVGSLGARLIGPMKFLAPSKLARAVWICLTRRSAPS